MINFKIKERLTENNMSRYKLQKLTNWNYKRVNTFYKGTIVEIRVEELEKLCKIFGCKVGDLIEHVQD